MKKTIAALTITFLLLVLLSGCSASGDTANTDLSIISQPTIEAQPLLATEHHTTSATASYAAAGANDFAFRLSAALAQNFLDNFPNESFVVSPYSIWLPLAALLNTTSDYYKDELLESLGVSGINIEDINRAASRMLFDLTNERDRDTEWHNNPLSIANAVFVDDRFTLVEDFAQVFLDYYRGTIMNVNFADPDAVYAVNQWASEHTDGLISDLIQGFDPETAAVIANALHFSNIWTIPFEEDETSEGIFYSPAGELPAYFMLKSGNGLPYFEDDRVQATSFYFAGGGGMTIILPKDGDGLGLLSTMTAEYFDHIHQETQFKTGQILLPRFSISSTIDNLPDILTSLGVPLFEVSPVMDGLIKEAYAYLDDAVQKAMIEVDEKGTTAAAVTALIAFPFSGPMVTDPFEMICDSPFVFVLWGQTHDGGSQVLFTGVVNQP